MNQFWCKGTKAMKNVPCPFCGLNLTIGEEIGGKLVWGATAAVFGSRVNPVVGLFAGLLGIWFGHNYIDKAINTATRQCPQCGMLFRIADNLL
jgi:hypothetical protein